MGTDTNTCFECGRHLYSFAEITRLREQVRVLRGQVDFLCRQLKIIQEWSRPNMRKAIDEALAAIAATQPDAPEAEAQEDSGDG